MYLFLCLSIFLFWRGSSSNRSYFGEYFLAQDFGFKVFYIYSRDTMTHVQRALLGMASTNFCRETSRKTTIHTIWPEKDDSVLSLTPELLALVEMYATAADLLHDLLRGSSGGLLQAALETDPKYTAPDPEPVKSGALGFSCVRLDRFA